MSFWQLYKTRPHVPLILGAAVFLPALVVGFVLWHFLSEQIENGYQKRLETSLKIFELILENKLTSSEDSLTRFAADNTLQITIELDIRPQLKKYLASQYALTKMSFIQVTNIHGEDLATVGTLPAHFKISSDCSASCCTSIRMMSSLDDHLYAIFSVPVLSQNKLLGFVHGGFNLTTKEYRQHLRNKLDAVPAFLMNDHYIGEKQPHLPEKIIIEGEMYTLTVGAEHFKALRHSFILNGENILLEVQISIEHLQERMGKALWMIGLVFGVIIIVALFALWMYGLKIRAEEDKNKLEGQLRQAQKMEAVGTLAGGIAHDFNNILAAILGYAELAREEIPPSSRAKEDLDEVIRACIRAKDLVKQILTFSRKSPKERIAIAVYSLVNEAIKLIRASIPTTIEIRTNLDRQCGKICADPTQIHQVVMNICTNAAQAMEAEGGILEIGLHAVTLGAHDLGDNHDMVPGPYVELSISDSGPGIPAEIKNLIFDPYFTTKEMGKGSGMGLAVVHGIIKSHHGMIRVDSTVGRGTTFRLYFPRIEDEESEKIIEDSSLPRGKARILVVDDEQGLVDITCQRLTKLGYTATGETDSTAALELFCSNPQAFDLVISDFAMPKIAGDKLIQGIRAARSDIPVILCSGYGVKIDDPRFQGLNINAFTFKPMNTTELAQAVSKALADSDH